MYDKVKIWIDRYTMGQGGFEALGSFLSGAKEQTDLTTGEARLFGSLNGLSVSMYTGGAAIEGSLPKYLYGDNVHPLTVHTTKEALQKLADDLHVNIDDANILSLEYGANFVMKHPVSMYLELLGDMPRLTRLQCTPTSLYYKQNAKKPTKVINIYDKIAEAKSKGMPIPKGFEDANILRYELRLTGRLAKQLNQAEVTTARLYDRAFYCLLMEQYQGYYSSIQKQHHNKDYMEQIKTPNDALKVICAIALSQMEQSQIVGFVDELKDAKVFADRKNYTRLKKMLHDTQSKAACAVTDELIRELDDEVKNVAAYI